MKKLSIILIALIAFAQTARAQFGGGNITVTRMAGSSGHDFTGTFDGNGHTLTIAVAVLHNNN